jgi:4-hydroxybenzoate polyprenyltransferase
LRNWLILIKERFSPASYIPMILVFTGANGLFLCKVAEQEFPWPRFALALLLMLSFFFRMRCFDEIKDYDVDLKINPTRPLARRVLSIAQVKKGLFAMILFEILLAGFLGFWPFVVHCLAIFYSLLMYEEFFIGDLLRPHLTTYAVSHTFVSVLLGISSAIAMTSFDVQKLTTNHLYFFLMNWAFFNLFEFARKTFAPNEERPTVPSYSNIFGPRLAWMLSWSQVILGVGLVFISLPQNPRLSWIAAGAVVYTLVSLGYFIKPQNSTAKIFRNVTGIYLLGHYILLCLALGA